MTSYPGELGVMYQKFVTPGPDNFHHIRKLDIRLRSNIPASPAYNYTSRSITDPQPAAKSQRKRSKTAPHKLSATTRNSEVEYIQDIIVPLSIDHHEAKNMERSVSSNSFGSRSQVKRVPLHHTSQETLPSSPARLNSPRETKSLPIFGERYTRSGPGSTTSEDSLTLYGASPHQRKVWNSSPQARRLEAEQRFVAKSRMLKRTSEAQVHSHRVDRMYYMQGRSINTKHRYDVDEAELQRLRELARVRSMHYNRAYRGDHYTPHTVDQNAESSQQQSSAGDLPQMTVTGRHMVSINQTFVTQNSEADDGSSPPNRPNSPLTSRSGGAEDSVPLQVGEGQVIEAGQNVGQVDGGQGSVEQVEAGQVEEGQVEVGKDAEQNDGQDVDGQVDNGQVEAGQCEEGQVEGQVDAEQIHEKQEEPNGDNKAVEETEETVNDKTADSFPADGKVEENASKSESDEAEKVVVVNDSEATDRTLEESVQGDQTENPPASDNGEPLPDRSLTSAEQNVENSDSVQKDEFLDDANETNEDQTVTATDENEGKTNEKTEEK